MSEKYITGHWDTMEEGTRKVYLEHRYWLRLASTIAWGVVGVAAVIVGAIAHNNREAALTERELNALQRSAPSLERARQEHAEHERTMRAARVKEAYEACLKACVEVTDRCAPSMCPEDCAESVERAMPGVR